MRCECHGWLLQEQLAQQLAGILLKLKGEVRLLTLLAFCASACVAQKQVYHGRANPSRTACIKSKGLCIQYVLCEGSGAVNGMLSGQRHGAA